MYVFIIGKSLRKLKARIQETCDQILFVLFFLKKKIDLMD